MSVKLSPEDLNLCPCHPLPISTYICGVTIAPKVCGGKIALNSDCLEFGL